VSISTPNTLTGHGLDTRYQRMSFILETSWA